MRRSEKPDSSEGGPPLALPALRGEGGEGSGNDIVAAGDIIGGDKATAFDQRNQTVGTQINVAGDYVVTSLAIQGVGVLSLHQLPPPPRDFTGRKAELDELLAQVGGGVTISSLRGMGGIGKTALALALADRLKARYPDAQFYLDLRGAHRQQPRTVADALAHVVRAYQPTAKLPESEAELSGLYQSVLNNQRALLLMDNAADRWQVEPLLPPSTCFLLVTSRQHFTLPGLHARDLDTLPPGDARDPLLKIAPRIDSAADEIARLCGYLPLALRLAAGALAERIDLSVAEYIRRLSDSRKRLELVEASIDLSYALLNEALQRRWRALAVFPASFDTAAAGAVWQLESDAAKETLGDLLRLSLVEWDAPSARYSLHDLVRLYAAVRLEESGEQPSAQRQHAAHYAAVIHGVQRLYEQGGESIRAGLSQFDVESPNILTGQAWAAAHLDDDDQAAQACNRYAGQWSVLSLRLHPRDYIAWLTSALAAARKLQYRQAEGGHLGNLGLAYFDLGDTGRAIEFYRQALTIFRQIGDHHGEANSLMNLGLAYLDDIQRAIEFHEEALVIFREIGDRQGQGRALSNLGSAYRGLGDARHAIEYHEQALVIDREIGDRRGEGADLGNLGAAYAALGDARRAIEFYEQCLAIARDIGDRRGEGAALGNLGTAYAALGDARRAIEFYEQALVIAHEIDDRRGEGNALWNMSLALEALGDRAQAIANAEAALAIYEQIEDPRAEKVRRKLAKWRGS